MSSEFRVLHECSSQYNRNCTEQSKPIEAQCHKDNYYALHDLCRHHSNGMKGGGRAARTVALGLYRASWQFLAIRGEFLT